MKNLRLAESCSTCKFGQVYSVKQTREITCLIYGCMIRSHRQLVCDDYEPTTDTHKESGARWILKQYINSLSQSS